MSTGRELCEGALNIIGAHSPIKKAKGETFQVTFKTLQGILETYTSQGVAMGVTIPSVITEEVNEPPQVTVGLKYILAVKVAPFIRKTANVTAEIKKEAKAGRQIIRNQFGPKPGQCYPDNLNIGSGNKTRPIGAAFYPEEETLDDSSGSPITI